MKALLPVPPCHILRFAACQGVLKTTFDNEAELHKISRSHPSAELLVRIRADDPDAVINLGVKFGASVLQACHLLDVAKEMNLNVVGIRYACVCACVCGGPVLVDVSLQCCEPIAFASLVSRPFHACARKGLGTRLCLCTVHLSSFHVGCSCKNASTYSRAIEMAHKVFTHGKSIGLDLTILDIGGGFPGHRGGERHFSELASTIRSALAKWFGGEELRVIAEPGRFFAESTHTLAVCVTSKREEIAEDGKKVGGA